MTMSTAKATTTMYSIDPKLITSCLLLARFCLILYSRKVFAHKLPNIRTHPILYKKGASLQPIIALVSSSSEPAWKLIAIKVDEEMRAPTQINAKKSGCDAFTIFIRRFLIIYPKNIKHKDHEMPTAT